MNVFDDILVILLIGVRVFLVIGVIWLVVREIRKSGRIKKNGGKKDG